MSYEIDDELEAWFDAGLGAKGPILEVEQSQQLLRRALTEAWSSSVGRDLRSRVGDKFDSRFVEELSKRFGATPFYSNVYFRFRDEEVIRDLLLEAPPARVRPAGVNEHGVNLNFEPSRGKPAPTKEETSFAHAWKKTVQEKGIGAVKARGGVVALSMPNGSVYEYNAQDADRLLNRCLELGLVS